MSAAKVQPKEQSLVTSVPPVALVALAAWVLPGLGYWLIRERTRAIAIGVTILLLYASGLLIGNVRVVDVPGYDNAGEPVLIEYRRERVQIGGREGEVIREYRVSPGDEFGRNMEGERKWIVRAHFLSEIVNKPWYVGQFLVGPANLFVSWISLHAAHVGAEASDVLVPRSHARVAEIGTLYTAVAGMLNLMAIIDSAWRAAHRGAKS
jgi:hypothetical protein